MMCVIAPIYFGKWAVMWQDAHLFAIDWMVMGMGWGQGGYGQGQLSDEHFLSSIK
jgi:hypothetical protein